MYFQLKSLFYEVKEVSLGSYFNIKRSSKNTRLIGSRNGTVVRALAFHQCGPGSIPGLGDIWGLSLLLVPFLTPRVFIQVLWFSSLHKNQHLQIPIPPDCKAQLIIFIYKMRYISSKLLWLVVLNLYLYFTSRKAQILVRTESFFLENEIPEMQFGLEFRSQWERCWAKGISCHFPLQLCFSNCVTWIHTRIGCPCRIFFLVAFLFLNFCCAGMFFFWFWFCTLPPRPPPTSHF